MARLRHLESGRAERLLGEHTIGRSGANLLRLEEPRASGHHALLRWTGADWELCELGSRNGSWIEGRRLEAGQRQLVLPGQRLAFGREDDLWVLEDGTAPVLCACSEAGVWQDADDGLLVLPSAAQPEAVIYGDDQGHWIVEQDAAQSLLEASGGGVLLEVGGERWRVYPPAALAPTRTHASPEEGTRYDLGTATLAFRVSLDEEHVELELREDGQLPLRLPHRAQHYLLLTLARARTEDLEEDPDLPAAEQGWRYRDALCRGLRIPENQFNVALFRARQHLGKAGLLGAEGIVERRRGSGQLRLGTARFTIEGL